MKQPISNLWVKKATYNPRRIIAMSPGPEGAASWSVAAFTLIELLIVISIIAILAGLLFPLSGVVNRQKIRAKARAELNLVQMAIENYKSKLGHYPPDNPGQTARNQLYFELLGTTRTNVAGVWEYTTLDGSARLKEADFPAAFGSVGGGRTRVSGFVNTSGQGGGDEARNAQRFLGELKPGQVGFISDPPGREQIKYLVCSVPWTKQDWVPLSGNLNPFRYNSSNPTNNPNSFDLWVDVIISGKTNRISNWSKEPTIVSLPY